MGNAQHVAIDGFIVHRFVQTVGHGQTRRSRLALLGRAADGRTFAAVLEPFRPSCFVRNSDREAVADLGPTPEDRTTIDGEPVQRVTFGSLRELRNAADRLRSEGVRTYEADVAPADALLIDRNIHGSVHIEGAAGSGSHVDLVFLNPQLTPSEWEPRLTVLSLDIETDPTTDRILAVGLVVDDSGWSSPVSEVHFLAPEPSAVANAASIVLYDDEASLLSGVMQRITAIDPDIVTGWNVIDFDMAVIGRRLEHHRIPFTIARSDEPARVLPAGTNEFGRRQNAGISCQGRQVVDALRLVRYGPERFEDRKLGSVAHAVLGEGKAVEAATSAEKIQTLLALYRDDPVAFCDYCRKDAELVLRILDATGLLQLTLRRCRLTGIGMSRAWTSIPAFEFLYLEAMHARGLVGPTRGVDRLPAGDAPGGAIITPQPGLFRNVLVFDFKSLYPSIIRTFGIDPVGYRGMTSAYRDGQAPPPDAQTITAPNGARFTREQSILPVLLDRFWESRDAAKRRNDDVASFVYKIIMNSFYGVLGTSGCRFAGAPLAGAITGFGQYILYWARDRLEERGLRVLYGDTDSLFVSGDPDATADTLFDSGSAICTEVNRQLAQFVATTFQVESRLELEFEKVYRRFYLPRVRHSAADADALEEVRGRAKGYAGLAADAAGATALEIKGMEAVRSDWTEAASDLQRELLVLMFADADTAAVVDHIRATTVELQQGALDEKLVYSRRLRKQVEAYTASRPPHVQAAALLPASERDGPIRYLITTAGPQPAAHRSAPIDYAHYLTRQIAPIAEPICEVLGISVREILDPSQQLSLF